MDVHLDDINAYLFNLGWTGSAFEETEGRRLVVAHWCDPEREDNIVRICSRTSKNKIVNGTELSIGNIYVNVMLPNSFNQCLPPLELCIKYYYRAVRAMLLDYKWASGNFGIKLADRNHTALFSYDWLRQDRLDDSATRYHPSWVKAIAQEHATFIFGGVEKYDLSLDPGAADSIEIPASA